MSYCHAQLNATPYSKCGSRVVISRRSIAHLAAHPDVIPILPEAIRLADFSGRDFVELVIDFGRVVGKCSLIECGDDTPDTKMLFAVRKGRIHPSRVTHSTMRDTTSVALVARKTDAKTYQLITAFFGVITKREPWDPSLNLVSRREALSFWCRHALAYSPDVMDGIFESTWQAVLEKVREGNQLVMI